LSGGAQLQANIWKHLSDSKIVAKGLETMNPRAFLETFVNSSTTELKAMETSMAAMTKKYYDDVPFANRKLIVGFLKPVEERGSSMQTQALHCFCLGLHLADKFEHEGEKRASLIEFGFPCHTTSFRFASPSDRQVPREVAETIPLRLMVQIGSKHITLIPVLRQVLIVVSVRIYTYSTYSMCGTYLNISYIFMTDASLRQLTHRAMAA
jgi:hypothetical protein